jgi:hypothetical protein
LDLLVPAKSHEPVALQPTLGFTSILQWFMNLNLGKERHNRLHARTDRWQSLIWSAAALQNVAALVYG